MMWLDLMGQGGQVTVRLFYEPLVVAIGSWLVAFAFMKRVQCKPHFRLRAIGLLVVLAACLGVICAVIHGMLQVHQWDRQTVLSVGGMLERILEFANAFGMAFVCGRMAWHQLLYGGAWIMICQRIIRELWVMLFHWYYKGQVWANSYLVWVLLFYGACCLALYFTACRMLPQKGVYKVGPRQLISAIALLVVFELLFYALISGISQNGFAATNIAALLPAQIYCAATLFFQNEMFRKGDAQKELALVNRMWYEQKAQYELSKENIALINQKCHDLKHQIAGMRTLVSPENHEKYLAEIEKAIRIYDSGIKTGNDVLDTLLTDKSLLCGDKQIAINCVADGHNLGFMDPVDLYTVLSNAIDNAIEEVQKFDQAEKRQIDILIYTERNVLIIQISNPLKERLRFQDGLPQTTKGSSDYHGYGLKSVSHTIEKYGGRVRIRTENERFDLKLIIPREN